MATGEEGPHGNGPHHMGRGVPRADTAPTKSPEQHAAEETSSRKGMPVHKGAPAADMPSHMRR